MDVIYYPSNLDAYQQGNIATWAKQNNLKYVVELHRNAGGGTGYETLIHSSFSADATDTGIHNAMISLGFVNRGIKSRSDLGNMNRMATAGISYSLIELGFIDNPNDNTLFDNIVSQIGKKIYTACSNAGVTRLGVIYGHGQGDPGASAYGRTEAADVRRITVTASTTTPPSTEPETYPLPAESTRLKLASGKYIFINVSSGSVLDCSYSKKTAQGWQANGEAQQIPRWEENYRRLIVTVDGKEYALDAQARKNGTQSVWANPPHSGQLQQWFLEHIKTTNSGIPVVRIISVYTGRCLDLDKGLHDNGTKISTWNSLNSAFQYWYAYKVG